MFERARLSPSGPMRILPKTRSPGSAKRENVPILSTIGDEYWLASVSSRTAAGSVVCQVPRWLCTNEWLELWFGVFGMRLLIAVSSLLKRSIELRCGRSISGDEDGVTKSSPPMTGESPAVLPVLPGERLGEPSGMESLADSASLGCGLLECDAPMGSVLRPRDATDSLDGSELAERATPASADVAVPRVHGNQ